MRARSIRLTVLILAVLGLALAALAFRNISIDLPGFSPLNRGGSGPLGLKLGLDLRGGGHLVYQADTGTQFNVTFIEPVTATELGDVLNKPDLFEGSPFPAFSLEPRGDNGIRITTEILDPQDPARQNLRPVLEEQLGALESYEVVDLEDPTPEQMEGVLDKINRRVNLFGTEEPIIQRFGEDRVIVQLPGASGSITDLEFSDPVTDQVLLEQTLVASGYEVIEVERLDRRRFKVRSSTVSVPKRDLARAQLEEALGAIQLFNVTSGIDEAKALIGRTARLEFKERTCTDSSCRQFTDGDLGLTGDDLETAFATADEESGGWAVIVHFKSRGTDIFSELTRRIVDQETKRIAVFLDDDEIIAPVARAWIRDGATRITGDFTREEARTISIQLEAGSLPVPLRLIQENDVSALLGAKSLRNSLLAGLVGLGLVILFMLAYYRMAGVVAATALVFYAIVVLAIFKLIPITLTLSHIGGFILSIGMAVDANILIFERMKEEVRIGRTLASSMEVGFNRAWPAIRDSNFSTIITCLVLLWFGDRLGGGLVTGFAISLLIGVLLSMFTAVVLSRNLLQLLAWVGLGRRIALFTPEKVQRTASTVGGGR
jgi:preprotein translocase subunit SecD